MGNNRLSEKTMNDLFAFKRYKRMLGQNEFLKNVDNVFKTFARKITDEITDQISSSLEPPFEMTLPIANLTQEEIKHPIEREINKKST